MVWGGGIKKNQREALAKLILSIFIVHDKSIRNDQSNHYEQNIKVLFISWFISNCENTVMKNCVSRGILF